MLRRAQAGAPDEGGGVIHYLPQQRACVKGVCEGRAGRACGVTMPRVMDR
jgi:hypothetical protein